MPTHQDLIDLLLWVAWDAYVIFSAALLGMFFGKTVGYIIVEIIGGLRK